MLKFDSEVKGILFVQNVGRRCLVFGVKYLHWDGVGWTNRSFDVRV